MLDCNLKFQSLKFSKIFIKKKLVCKILTELNNLHDVQTPKIQEKPTFNFCEIFNLTSYEMFTIPKHDIYD